MRLPALRLLLAIWLLGLVSSAQETRGMIYGRVLDPASGVVAGATIDVVNRDTNVRTRLSANETGYYEAPLLLPGNYEVSAEAQGFKKVVRGGITLPISTRVQVNFRLEVGTLAESVLVTAEAPLLDTSSVTVGLILDNRTLRDLPVLANNLVLLSKFTTGIQSTGENSSNASLHSINGASDYYLPGRVGGNEWSIDGMPNNGDSRRIAYIPYSDTVQEMKVETASFDASVGHGVGASIAMMTKSGGNALHGTLTEQHWQQRWHGTPFFVKQLHYRRIAEAEALGDTRLANELRAQPKQGSGRSNNFAATLGGPVVMPKLFSGKNRLFFFFSYSGLRESKPQNAAAINITVPTMAARQGDFSSLLQADVVRYQLHDPFSVRADPARASHYIREPIPGNVIPRSRIINPIADFYTKLLPVPNNDPMDPRSEPLANYLAARSPYIWDFDTFSNRIDYHHSGSHRFFGRWTWADFNEDRGDWTYETMRGLHTNGLLRQNRSAMADWVYTPSATTVIDLSFGANEFLQGNQVPVALRIKPSDVGLPAYLDVKAGERHHIPQVNATGYRAIGRAYPTSMPTQAVTGKLDWSHVRGSQTFRGGMEYRRQMRSGGGGGNTSGSFTFSNVYTKRNDDTFTPAGDIGHSWAAFLMGVPNQIQTAYSDSYVTLNPFFAWYGQDNWRLTRKLTLNAGLRLEYDVGPTERFNRVLVGFDRTTELPISAAAQAAYTRNPLPELTAASFVVKGGSVYPGSGGANRRWWANELLWMPRLGLAYQAGSRMVIRGGYGLYYDTLNVLNDNPDQLGYSRTTSTNPTNDFGVTWLAGDPRNGISPLRDPFPIRSDGTRFDLPTRDGLGLMTVAGRSYAFTDFDTRRARQQRWRVGVQRQISAQDVVEIAYNGMYSDRVYVTASQQPLPERFWADGLTRNAAIANDLNANVTNPFRISNFAALAASAPAVYQDLTTKSFFTSATIRKHQLLRVFPHMNGLLQDLAPYGKARSDALEITYQRRMAKGLSMNAGYTRLRVREADFYFNEFDPEPSWRESNNGRPHRLVLSGVYELPFGKSRYLGTTGLWNALFGGFQLGFAYEWQPGPLIDWDNLFYYGNLEDVGKVERTLDRWFNTDNFERSASRGPAAFHRRVFPTRIEALRADMTNQLNANVAREFVVRERVRLQVRFEALNAMNRAQFAAPNVNPSSSDFGRIRSQTEAMNRYLQVQGRILF